MKRRNVMGKATVGVAAAFLGGCSSQGPATETSPSFSVSSGPTLRWRMATSWPKFLDILFGGAELICRQVSAMTDGRFTITPYEAGEIVPGFGVLDAVSQGTVECGHSASYYYLDKQPALAFGTNVPFGLAVEQQNAWLYYGGGSEIVNQLYADFGIVSFPAGNTGVQMGGWFRRKINAVEDLKGLKMRIPGLGSQVMTRLGVQVQVLPADEIVGALFRGDIDAVEWNNPYDDEKMGLPEAAPYCYYPGWWEPGATYELQVNRRLWEELPVEYQEILKVAATNANVTMLAEYNARNGKVLERLTQSGTQFIPFSQEILRAAHQTTFELYEEYASQDATFRQVYEAWKAFRDRVYRWNQINELSFSNFMARNGGEDDAVTR
ncbi:MAG: ABC transporter substrate-binding protein [Cyanobacteriota bacterium]|nr:ABC transporter substrate-binding protein [Cyanobacteriota bacterium]